MIRCTPVAITSRLLIWYFPFSFTTAKDEPPDQWDEEEQQEEKKANLGWADKDEEYLRHKVVRDSSLDEVLKKDLQIKKSEPKYKEMLVRT